jgi:hypothetical protein
MAISDNILTCEGISLVREGIRELRQRLPPGWVLGEPRTAVVSQDTECDAVAEMTAPDRRTGLVCFEAKARLEPKGVLFLSHFAQNQKIQGLLVIVTRYLSEATQVRLREAGLSYIDLTGNMWISMSEPGLFVETHGASKDPTRQERPARSLRGAKAGRIVRALVDTKKPPGVRELATIAKVDAGYVSRVLAFLDSEALIARVERGRLQRVDWPGLLHRWAEEAPLKSRGQASMFLEPRGINALIGRLAKSEERYAVTGSLAAATYAPVAPSRLVTIWISDAAQATSRLALRRTEYGANVMLLDPLDESVFDGAVRRDGVWYSAPSQTAADLLTSPGRGPAEGEELIEWMKRNEEIWRR